MNYLVHVARAVCACALVAVAGGMLGGCATVVAGTTQEIAIDTDPEGASCILTRADGLAVQTVQTPTKVKVARSKHDLTADCSLARYAPAKRVIPSTIHATTVGNIFIGGLVGVAVDAATGANNQYPELVEIAMVPAHFANTAERDAFFDAAANGIRTRTAEKIKKTSESCPSHAREFCTIEVNRLEKARDQALEDLENRRKGTGLSTS